MFTVIGLLGGVFWKFAPLTLGKFKTGSLQKTLKNEGISRAWEIVIAFFLGGAVSSIAIDPSDPLFFWASSHGALSTMQQVLYWDIIPFTLYAALALLGFLIAKYTKVRATFLLWFYLVLVLLSTVISLSLPQSSSLLYLGVGVGAGTLISVAIILGLMSQVRRK
jgi:hypothetical protein